MSASLPSGPILTWAQAEDLIAYQDGRAATRLQTDVDSIYEAIGRRLGKHGPLDVGDDNGNVVGRLALDDTGRLRLERCA
ncbi:MAG: hypothetical protein U5K43_02350 [Halofilum sp. (in: g-proteobacteria)]|nr:hypothetical protein [Halofilum sp. (in: g-proteobacteria)]